MGVVRKGQIIYEVSGVPLLLAFKAMDRARVKLPFKTKIVQLTY